MPHTPPHHLILGAGFIGRAVAAQLLARGDEVTVATRSGTILPGAHAVTLDASNTAELTAAQAHAATTFVCTNPRYSRWPTDWPPIFSSLISASQTSGSRIVMMGNLYGHGKATMPMTEHSPMNPVERKGRIRADGWHQLLEAHNRGSITAVEVRASDYIGPHATSTTHVGERFFAPIMRSQTARVIGNPEIPHAWSYLPDIAATLIAAADADDRDLWGRSWLVPSTTRSRSEIAADINSAFGSHGRAARLPSLALHAAGLVNPDVKEVIRSSYQFEMPFVVDSRETEQLLGVRATAWPEVIRTTGESYLN
ncbi:NAD-dependent epimerase/dehydratase family protein [Leucobacter insecticola]|uniref:NAD-dependent epimerase/dehydratase family protein n=1 Tax=Leucobacter insecticola TaxID=2714934 RepID=A0A6G8FKS2_9MICO|nr:NAD-dependent epimerase/dehydratase family protein [Leucobacter insecticola]QIM16883.1 NAD-dependent epimerase/dehydratase family protein [Leucobacter insecticola]